MPVRISEPIELYPCYILSSAGDQCRPSCNLAGSEEINSSVNSPDCRNPQGQERFHLRAIPHEWQHEVGSHADQVRGYTENGDEHVFEEAVVRVTLVAKDTGNTA